MNLNKEEIKEFLKKLNFKNDLITAVTRDFESKDVLMVAFMNEKAVMKTLDSGIMHYWSRSRDELWKKGEVSGNIQKVKGVWVDCDGDALLFDVDPEGPACHKGYKSCFFRKLKGSNLVVVAEREFNPEEVYD